MARDVELRPWQAEKRTAWLRMLDTQEGPYRYTLQAIMGAGKTDCMTAMVVSANSLKGSGPICVVVPTLSLKDQWAQKLSERWGIELAPRVLNDDLSKFGLPPDFDGICVTYQQVASDPQTFARLFGHDRARIILDEPHHAGDHPDLTWAQALKFAFDRAGVVISGSATLLRTDRSPIPFVRMVEKAGHPGEWVMEPDGSYSYQQALRDRLLPHVIFPLYEGSFEWVSDKQRFQASFQDELPDNEISHRLRTALMPEGDWLPSVIREAHGRLIELRAGGDPDAAGLIVCVDQYHALRVASLVERITGTRATLVISDEPYAATRLEAFEKGLDFWLIAVRMVSEGSDIPRLRELVYATNIVTLMSFDQIVGRLLRGEAEAPCIVRLPADLRLKPLALRFIEERKLADQELTIVEPGGPEPGGGDPPAPEREFFPEMSDDAETISHVTGGGEISNALRDEALALLRASGAAHAGEDTIMAVARLIQQRHFTQADGREASTSNGHGSNGGTGSNGAAAARVPQYKQVQAKRDEVARKAKRFAHASGIDYKDVHIRLNDLTGVRSVKGASVVVLDRQLEILAQWILAGEMDAVPHA